MTALASSHAEPDRKPRSDSHDASVIENDQREDGRKKKARRKHEEVATTATAPKDGESSVRLLINDPETVVQQAIDGFLQTAPGLARLDGFPEIKVYVGVCFFGVLASC